MPNQKQNRKVKPESNTPGLQPKADTAPTLVEDEPSPGVELAVLKRAFAVFGNSERAIQWMQESNPALRNEPPIRVIQTEAGRLEVLNILGRIQHGVIS